MSELLPCPFCGGVASRRTVTCGGFDSIEEGTLRCNSCGAQGPTKSSSWNDIQNGWNKRTPTPDATGKVLLTKEQWEEAQRDKARMNWLATHQTINYGLTVGGYKFKSDLIWQQERIRDAIDAARADTKGT